MSSGSETVKIRPFVEGRDEGAWIELFNAYYSLYYGREFEPLDEDDVEWAKSTPWWRDSQVFLAKLAGEPVGIIRAYLDRLREPPKGYIYDFAVRPGLEGSGICKALIERALSWLSAKGARIVHAYARDNMKARMRLYETLGFKVVRRFSIMRLKPGGFPRTLGPAVRPSSGPPTRSGARRTSRY